MDRHFTAKWLEEKEKALWDLCDNCEKTQEMETLFQHCRKYVAMLKDDREWYRMCCAGMQRRVDAVLKGEKDPEIERLKTELKAKEQMLYNTRMDYAAVLKGEKNPEIERLKTELKAKEQMLYNTRMDYDAVLKREKIPQIERLKTELKAREQILYNTRMDYAKMVKNLEGPANVHAEVVKKLQEKVKELEKTVGVTNKRLEKCMKEQEEIRNELEKLQGNASKFQKEKHNQEMRLQQLELDNLHKSLGSKDTEIAALKRELEKTKRDLENAKSDMENERALFIGIQDVLTTALDKFVSSDTSHPQTEISCNEEIVKKIHFTFVQYVVPPNVLHYFHKYDTNILAMGDIERVRSETESHGNMCGAGVLLDRLCRYKDWFPCLLKVLRDPDVKMEHVADKMDALIGSHEIVFVREGYDLEDMKSRCSNKEHHDKLIPVDEFRDGCLNDLDLHDPSMVEAMLKNAFDLVVRIDITQTNASNPNTLSGNTGFRQIGSGIVRDKYKFYKGSKVPCRCHECKESPQPKKKWAEFGVLTAMGLMQYDPECRLTVCRLSYKDPSGKEVDSVLKPVEISNKRKQNDNTGLCQLSCITHDQRLAEEIAQKLKKWKRSRRDAVERSARGSSVRCAIVSYPHGLEKSVSVGKILKTDTYKGDRLIYDAVTCEGCCGAPVFFFEKGVFTGHTIHDGKNKTGNNQSIRDRFY